MFLFFHLPGLVSISEGGVSMDDLIKKLIEVDRTARKSVENAAGARVAAVRELDERS